MQTITQVAVDKIRNNPVCIGRLMVMFEKYEVTIKRWLVTKDVRLVTPSALSVISEETGLPADKILAQEKKHKVPA